MSDERELWGFFSKKQASRARGHDTFASVYATIGAPSLPVVFWTGYVKGQNRLDCLPRLEALDARVVALEAGRASPVGLPLSVEPIPYGDGDGFAVLVTLPSGRCLSVDRDSDRCLTVERDLHRKYRTQREVDAAVRYWRGVFGLGVST